jgi:hypothetical protein
MNLSPAQALDLLTQAAAQFRGTRQEHELLEKAVATLAGVLPKPVEKPETD